MNFMCRHSKTQHITWSQLCVFIENARKNENRKISSSEN